jgi:hypothetical protein
MACSTSKNPVPVANTLLNSTPNFLAPNTAFDRLPIPCLPKTAAVSASRLPIPSVMSANAPSYVPRSP